MGLLQDIAALAKAGYTPSEVKQLMDLDKKLQDVSEEAPEITPKEDVQPEEQKQSISPEEVKDPDDRYKEMQAEIDTLKANLEKAQRENAAKNIQAPQKDTQDGLNDILRELL